MFVVTLRFTIQPEKKEDTIAILTALCSQTEVLPGCKLCRLYSRIKMDDGGDEILLLERWKTKESLEKHIVSSIFQQLIDIINFSMVPPELLFYNVSETTGIEMVEDLCRNKLNSRTFSCFQ
jgi:quinol monooxygenase YgiN